MERSRVSSKGQTVIPKAVRDALGIAEGSELIWSLDDRSVRLIVRPRDPIAALDGILKDSGDSVEAFLKDRQAEREAEEADLERHGYGLPRTT